MKFDFGAGYRVYFAVDGDEIILLLSAGITGQNLGRAWFQTHDFTEESVLES